MEDSLSKKLAVLQDISDDDLLDNIEHSRIFCASLLSSMVLTLCDHVVTFEDEVHQVWRHRQNIVTIGFFLARYLTLFSRSFDLFIHMYSRWSATLQYNHEASAPRDIHPCNNYNRSFGHDFASICVIRRQRNSFGCSGINYGRRNYYDGVASVSPRSY
ncbi:hypothetical protein JB92DRAFT_205921 [Gautieria morchelliformis]|nr:hypothetical protein JB92DRAFT_205921 [Gautieria morchelliformis]